jgi:hypothetical protein
MVTLRSKPKRQYHPRGRHEGHNVQTQNSESEADLRCGGHQCLLCGTIRSYAVAAIADAEILRKYGTELATRQISPNRPFKRRTPAGF